MGRHYRNDWWELSGYLFPDSLQKEAHTCDEMEAGIRALLDEIKSLKEEVNDRCERTITLSRELFRSQEERTWLSRDVAMLSEEIDSLHLSNDLLQEDNRILRHSVQCLKAQSLPADKAKAAFFEGYRWCCSEQDIDWEDYEEDCRTCWDCSEAKKETA